MDCINSLFKMYITQNYTAEVYKTCGLYEDDRLVSFILGL